MSLNPLQLHVLNHLKVKFWSFLLHSPHLSVSGLCWPILLHSCKSRRCHKRSAGTSAGQKTRSIAFMFCYKVLMVTSARSCVCVCLRCLITITDPYLRAPHPLSTPAAPATPLNVTCVCSLSHFP